jgi:hypothetical protein
VREVGLLLIAGATACGPAVNLVDAAADAPTASDARPLPDAFEVPDACITTPVCNAFPSYPDLGFVEGGASEGEGPLGWSGPVPAPCDVEYVHVQVTLVNGQGVFSAGVETGTYPLQGNELAFDTCGACVGLWSRSDTAALAECYFATGGTLVLSSVEGRLTGSLEDASFAQIDCSTQAATGTCSSTLEGLAFDEPIFHTI